MAIRKGATPIVGIRKGVAPVNRVYKGASLIYEAAPTYDYPVVVQTSKGMDLPDAQAFDMVVYKYSFANPLTPGNWLVAFLTSVSDRGQFTRPGWGFYQRTMEGALWPRIDAKKITADTPQQDLVGWAELGALSRPLWVVCEVAGVNPAATTLPCTVGGDQGWGFENRTAHTQARTINADKTLFMGFQCVAPSTSGNTGDASYIRLADQASAPQNRACALLAAVNQPAGKSMPMIRTGGSDSSSGFAVIKIRPS